MLSKKATYVCLRKRNHKRKKIIYNPRLQVVAVFIHKPNETGGSSYLVVWPMLRAGAKYQIRHFHFWKRLMSTCLMEHDMMIAHVLGHFLYSVP